MHNAEEFGPAGRAGLPDRRAVDGEDVGPVSGKKIREPSRSVHPVDA
jgi:hypothetical protein